MPPLKVLILIFPIGFLHDSTPYRNAAIASSWNGADGNGYNLGFAEEDKSVVINDEANIVVNSTNDAPNNNMNIAAGTYDIYFDLGAMQVWVMTPGNTPSQN